MKCENCDKEIRDKNDGVVFTGNDETFYICQKCLDNNYKLKQGETNGR